MRTDTGRIPACFCSGSTQAAPRVTARVAVTLLTVLAVLIAAVPASLAGAETTLTAPPSDLNVTVKAASGGLLGVQVGHTRKLLAPLSIDQRFDMQNFLPVTQAAAGATVEQSRVAGYTFLRGLSTPMLRAAVAQAPTRDYAQIQKQLAQQQQQTAAALLGQGDLSALLFGAGSGPAGSAGSAGGSSLVSGVTYLTDAEVAAITNWQTAKASWYGPGFYGRHTADGTTYDDTILLVANKTLPMGTRVAISFGGRTVIAPVKDRGPYVAGRDFDLSGGLAAALGFSGVQTIQWAIVP